MQIQSIKIITAKKTNTFSYPSFGKKSTNIKSCQASDPLSQLSEKEKMLSGFMHIPVSDELRADKRFAQNLCFKYNNLNPSEREKKNQIIRKLFAKTGDWFKIESGFKCDYGYNIEIGNGFFANYNLVILDSAKVKFGDGVMIGPNCGFYTVNHPLDSKMRAKGLQSAKPITVGNNVWIGGNAAVLGGVNIGDNTVVAAGSVVTKDLPPNTLCAGVPCKVIKQLN